MQSLHERLGTAISSLLSCSKDGNPPFLRGIVKPRETPKRAPFDATTVPQRLLFPHVERHPCTTFGPPLCPVTRARASSGRRREHRVRRPARTPPPLPEIPTPNAATRIAQFRQLLNDPTAGARLKPYDLVWLLYLVGDIHRPLHAVSKFIRELPNGDLGGNRIRVCAAPCRQELHYFWDASLGSGTAARALALARDLPPPPSAQLAEADVPTRSTWIIASAPGRSHEIRSHWPAAGSPYSSTMPLLVTHLRQFADALRLIPALILQDAKRCRCVQFLRTLTQTLQVTLLKDFQVGLCTQLYTASVDNCPCKIHSRRCTASQSRRALDGSDA
jgi:hypothetical protein